VTELELRVLRVARDIGDGASNEQIAHCLGTRATDAITNTLRALQSNGHLRLEMASPERVLVAEIMPKGYRTLSACNY
jgi:hypothetical protein